MPQWSKLPDDTPLLWNLDNPKQLGTVAYAKYEAYKTSTTLGEARAKGVRVIDLGFDYRKGWLKLNLTTQTAPSWSPCGLDGAAEFLASLSLQDLGKLLAASLKVAGTALHELRRRCRDFKFQPGQFTYAWHTTRGRLHPGFAEEASRRLVVFLRARHRDFFQTLNLEHAPIKALQDPSLQPALRSMRALKKVVLPREGWESSSKKRCFTRLHGVAVEFVAPLHEAKDKRVGPSKLV